MAGCCACFHRLFCWINHNADAASHSGREYRPPQLALHPTEPERPAEGQPLLGVPAKCTRASALRSSHSRNNSHSNNSSSACNNAAELLSTSALAGGGACTASDSSSSTPVTSFSHPSSGNAAHKARQRRTGNETSSTKHHRSGSESSSKHQHLRSLSHQNLQAKAAANNTSVQQPTAKQTSPTLHDVDQEKAAAKLGFEAPPSSKGDEDDDSHYCPTCLELYTNDNPKTFTSCGHHFHLPCLFEWLERKDTCPICESKLQFDGLD